MLALRDPAEVQAVQDPEVRALLARRFVEIADGDDYDAAVYGYFLLLEAGDGIEEVEQAAGVSWRSALGGALRGWEVITEHPCCYEAVFVLDDTGYGVDVLVPKHQGIDPQLLGVCSAFAVPEPPAP
jgi:hypothetical protein